MDSPVIAEVSTLLCPLRTMPSVAMRSPGLISMTCPAARSRAGTLALWPSVRTVALWGTSLSSARSPARARSIARSSKASAME